MYTISALCCFLGFYCLFNTSKKATLHTRYRIVTWLQQNHKYASLTGSILLLLSFIGLVYLDGSEAGSLSFVVLLMAVASLVVILSPFKIIKCPHLLFILAFLLLTEFLIF